MIPDIMRTFIRYSLDKYISHIEQEQQRDQQEQQDERQDEQGVIVASGRSAGAYQQQQDQFLYHQNRLTAPITKTNLYRNNRNMLSPDDDGISNFIIENINNHSIEILSDDDLNTSLATALSQVLLASPTSVILGSQENVTVEDINSFYFYETEQFTVLWVLFAIIVLGNSAVLVTLLLNKKSRQSRMNYFIKQLAIADLSVGIINVLTDIIWRITVEWRAGNVACKFIRFLQCLVTYASTYVLVSLSIDRYDAITHPMNFSGSWKRARRLVAAAWILSALFSSPMLVLFEERLIQEQRQCWIELDEPWRWQLYMSLVSTALFLVPTIIISACYAIILKTIWSKGTLLGSIDRSRTGDDRGSRRASSRGIIPRAKVKTVKMTIVIVIVFIFCWSPYIIFDLLQVFGKIPRTQTNIAVATFIQSLAPLNSAANPLIYCIFSTEVCRAIRQLPPFRWIASSWCCKSHSPTSTANRCATRRLHNHNNNSDSMRTFTTSISSRRSTSVMRGSRVVIMERPKTLLTMSEV